jgi:hypothetical protein
MHLPRAQKIEGLVPGTWSGAMGGENKDDEGDYQGDYPEP